MKAEIAAQIPVAKKSRSLMIQFDSQVAQIESLQEKLAQMTASLSESQAENKTLAAKLAANRAAAASVESANTKSLGSTAHANGGVRIMGTAEAAQVAQAAQLKEDLHGDLSGLLIRGVKRDLEDDVFDCIQTRRNGSKFTIPNREYPINY